MYCTGQGQNFEFLLQLPAGLPKITILVAQQLTLHMKIFHISVAT
jgi:hypothetical protein